MCEKENKIKDLSIVIKNPKICANCKDFGNCKKMTSAFGLCDEFKPKNENIKYNKIPIS